MHEKHIDHLSSISKVITMQNGTEKNKEQGKTQHETPRRKNHKATHKNKIRYTALERSVA